MGGREGGRQRGVPIRIRWTERQRDRKVIKKIEVRHVLKLLTVSRWRRFTKTHSTLSLSISKQQIADLIDCEGDRIR